MQLLHHPEAPRRSRLSVPRRPLRAARPNADVAPRDCQARDAGTGSRHRGHGERRTAPLRSRPAIPQPPPPPTSGECAAQWRCRARARASRLADRRTTPRPPCHPAPPRVRRCDGEFPPLAGTARDGPVGSTGRQTPSATTAPPGCAEADPVGEAPRPVHDHQAPLRVRTRRPHVFGAWACIGAATIVRRARSAALLERTRMGEVPP